MLAVVETHPIQYHVPVYREVQRQAGIPVTAIYGSDFSLRAYRDREFGTDLTWDVDLTTGLRNEFLSKAAPAAPIDPTRLSAAGVGRVFDEIRPAAVLIVGYSPAFHRQAWRAARRRGLPVLFRGETTDRPQARHRLVTAARGLALRRAYRSCDRVLYIGERSRRHYLMHGVDESRLVFSPYCVDTSPFRTGEDDRDELRAEGRRRLGVGEEQVVLLFSGKLSVRKGVDLLVPAVRRLPEALRQRVVLACTGDGQERDAIARAAAESPAVPVTVLGVQPQAALSRWYHAADLLLLPSRTAETWGLVVNEALHHGVPCVVSHEVGCAPDLIDEGTGAICRADSVEALAGAIEDVCARLAGREPTRRHCREKVSRFSVGDAARGIATAFEAVVGVRAAT